MKAGTFIGKLRVHDLDAKVVVNTGWPNYSRMHVKDVRMLKDGTISITLGKPDRSHE
jgi:hypothetical protein